MPSPAMTGCLVCERPLPPGARADARTCSARCRTRLARQRRAARPPEVAVEPTTTTVAVTAAVVAVSWLADDGLDDPFDVWHEVSR